MSTRLRIGAVTQRPPELDDILRTTAVGDGARLLLSILAHNPRLLKRFNVLAGGLLAKGVVPARHRELVILRMGFRCNSLFEFGEHSVIGRQSGLSTDEIADTTKPVALSNFKETDRALIQMVDDLYERNEVRDETWAVLRVRWNESELLELLIVAGFYWMVAGVLNSVGAELQGGLAGWPERMSEWDFRG